MSQAVGESVVARLRPHGRALVWPTVALIVIAGAAGYFVGRFAQPWENYGAAGVAAFLALLLWFIPTIRWLGNYTITTRRIILRRGSTTRLRQELAFSRAYDVTLTKTVLQSVFGSGDLHVNAGVDAWVVLRDVPRASLVQAALHELIEANRERS